MKETELDETQTPAEPPSQPAVALSQKSGFGLFGHLIAFLVCVGFPGFVSLMAPVSWVKIERNGEKFSATAKVCMFFVIPFRILTVEDVRGVDSRIQQGRSSPAGRTSHSKSDPDPEGFLVIQGNGDTKIEVPVSTSDVESVRDRVKAFLENSQGPTLRQFVAAHWTVGVVVVGFLSLMTLVYLFDRMVLLIRVVQRMCGVEESNLLLAERLSSNPEQPPPTTT